jgi:hypothetical protein
MLQCLVRLRRIINKLETPARVAGLLALPIAAVVYNYVVWRFVNWAWMMGLRFYGSDVVTAEAVRDDVQVFFLICAVFLFPRFAGLGYPNLRAAGWPLYGYLILLALAVAAVGLNRIAHAFTNPFAGHGPFFFTLGPAGWELMWPGLIFGFAAALAGERFPPKGLFAIATVFAIAGAAWYVPVFVGMRPMDKVAFVGVTIVINFLSFHLRRRTGSIWLGLAGHLLVKFLLTW